MELDNRQPYMTQVEYAKYVGVSKDVVRNWVANKHVASMIVGRYRMVNLLAERRKAEQAADEYESELKFKGI